MKKLSHTVLVLFLVATGCIDDFDERIREQDANPFHVIRLKAVANVVLKNAPEYSIKIIADNDVINEIAAVAENDTLLITNSAKGKWLNPERNYIVIEISAPEFHTFISDVSYSLKTDGVLAINDFYLWNFYDVKISDVKLELAGNYFYYWNNWLAGGKLEVAGVVNSAYFNNYALHVIEARELFAQNVTMLQYGREDCYLRAESRLEYSLNGPGDIVLYGDPQTVLIEQTSTGRLVAGN